MYQVVRKFLKILLLCFFFIVVILIVIRLSNVNRISFSVKESPYAIGLFEGDNLSNLAPKSGIKNPIIQATDVTDIKAKFVADPFVIKERNKYFLFFEAMNSKNNKADIGLAISDDGRIWHYDKIVLHQPFHLSYPYVFKWEGNYYMIPESGDNYEIALYKAKSFPYQWEKQRTLIRGNYVDSSIFFYKNAWWMFTNDTKSDVLHLFWSRQLFNGWTPHKKSPLITGNKKIARSAGRVFIDHDKIYRFAQNCEINYGSDVSAFEITKLTPFEYEEKPLAANPILKGSGIGFNAKRMHHIDPMKVDNKIFCVVDGVSDHFHLQFSFFKVRIN
jgi:hypothetical protein